MNTSSRNVAFTAPNPFTLIMQNAELILVSVKSKTLPVTLAVTFILNMIIMGGIDGAAYGLP